ncbi:MAG: hypothetical protein U1D30_19790 [Planctomycetota bacterium]
MDEAVARMIVFGILAVAAIVWCAAFWFVASSVGRARPQDEFNPFGEEDSGGYQVFGRQQVRGRPETLLKTLARHLAQPTMMGRPSFQLDSVNANRLTFQYLNPANLAPIARGEVHIDSVGGGGSMVHYRIRMNAKAHWLLVGAKIALVLGLASIVVAIVIMERFVISNPSPAIRWQSVQAVQVVHFIWPPFLFAGIYRQQRGVLTRTLESTIHNLAVLDEEANASGY